MSVTAVALILAAALCHATWNLVAKRSGGGLTFVWLFGLISAVGLTPAGLWTVWRDSEPLGWQAGMAVAGTSLIHLGYFALLQWAYRGGDLSVVYPVARGAGPLLTVAYALALLGERPGWLPLAGCLAILAGIAGLTGLGRRSLRLDRSTRAGLLVGVCIAAYTLWDRWAVVEVGVPPVSYLWLQSVGYAALLTPRVLRSGRGRRLRDVPVRAAVAVAVLSATSYLIVLEVLTFAPVSLVAPLREVSILVAALLGRLLLREPMTAQKAASATLVMAGVGAIALG